MAKEITSRVNDYSQWYNDLIIKGGLADYSAVRGCMVIKPYGFAIWEKMKDALDTMPKMDATVTGKVASVCQKEGCWLKLDAGNNETMFMNWDHKFTVPKDIAGKTVIATGYAYHDTTSIDQLKEYAKDDNKSQAAIDSITQPKIEVKFLATGLVIK